MAIIRTERYQSDLQEVAYVTIPNPPPRVVEELTYEGNVSRYYRFIMMDGMETTVVNPPSGLIEHFKGVHGVKAVPLVKVVQRGRTHWSGPKITMFGEIDPQKESIEVRRITDPKTYKLLKLRLRCSYATFNDLNTGVARIQTILGHYGVTGAECFWRDEHNGIREMIGS